MLMDLFLTEKISIQVNVTFTHYLSIEYTYNHIYISELVYSINYFVLNNVKKGFIILV